MSPGLGHFGVLPIEIRSQIYQCLDFEDALRLEQVSQELREELYVIKSKNVSELWRKLQAWGMPFFELLERNTEFIIDQEGGSWWCEYIEIIKSISFEKRKTRVIDEQNRVSYKEENDLVLAGMNDLPKKRSLQTIVDIIKNMGGLFEEKPYSLGDDLIGERFDLGYKYDRNIFMSMLDPCISEARRSLCELIAYQRRDERVHHFLIPSSNQVRAFVGEMAYSIETAPDGEEVVRESLENLLSQEKWNPCEEGFVIGCLASLAKSNLPKVLEYIERIRDKEKVILELADIFRRYEERAVCNQEGNEGDLGFLKTFIERIHFKERGIKTQLELIKIMSKAYYINALVWAKEIEDKEIRNQAIVEILYQIPVFIVAGGVEGVEELLKLAEDIPQKLIKNKRGLKTILKYVKEVMKQAPQNIPNIPGDPGECFVMEYCEYEQGMWRTVALNHLIQEYTKIAAVIESDREILELLQQMTCFYEYSATGEIPAAWMSVTNYAFHVREERAFVEVLEGVFSRMFSCRHYQGATEIFQLVKLWITKLAESPFKDSSSCVVWLLGKLSDAYQGYAALYLKLYQEKNSSQEWQDQRLAPLNEAFIEFMKHFATALKEEATAHKFSELIRNMEMVMSLPSLERRNG